MTSTFTNTGNRTFDSTYVANSSDSGNLVCDGQGSANIPVGNVHVSTTAPFPWAQGDAVTNASQTLVLGLAKSTDGATATTPAYFRIKIPAAGIRGTCTNTITFAPTPL